MSVYRIDKESKTFHVLCEYLYETNLRYRDANDNSTRWEILKEYVEKYNGRAIRGNNPGIEFTDESTYNWFLGRFD